MRKVPREEFLPQSLREFAYEDTPPSPRNMKSPSQRVEVLARAKFASHTRNTGSLQHYSG